MYGIRRYRNGSWLSLHVDRVDTHVVSAILQIDQEVDEDWPLYLIGQSKVDFPWQFLWSVSISDFKV